MTAKFNYHLDTTEHNGGGVVVEAFTLHSDMVSPAKWGNMQTSTTNKIIINMTAKFHYCLDTNEHNGGGGGGRGTFISHKDYGGRVKGGGGGGALDEDTLTNTFQLPCHMLGVWPQSGFESLAQLDGL